METPTGRPPELTPAISQSICQAIADGLSRAACAKAVGVHLRTIERWVKQGRGGAEPYAGFYRELQKALAERERRMVKAVMDAAEGRHKTTSETVVVRARKDQKGRVVYGADNKPILEVVERTVKSEAHPPNWQAAMTYLERSDPARWARVSQEYAPARDEDDEDDLPPSDPGQDLVGALTALPVAEQRRLLEALRQSVEGEEPAPDGE